MANVILDENQLDAIRRMKNGCILCGGVGSGKSRTSLAYYYIHVAKGSLKINGKGTFRPPTEPRDVYIITTAKKRDSLEWLDECLPFGLIDNVVVDSWNNIKKYTKVFGAFFIFDEQRVVGYGAWTKAFLNITRKNQWILLSATPGDKWPDYIPVFVANGFYKNKTQFEQEHIIYDAYANYPKIKSYMNERLLEQHRNDILITMKRQQTTIHHHIDIKCDYNKKDYQSVFRDRWNIFDNEPIEETGKLCYLMRQVVNSDESRREALDTLLEEHDRVIIFYNYTFELEIIEEVCINRNRFYAQWNGKKHEPVPEGEQWVYIVHYAAGAEGWNCITTDTIIFYSPSYSYRQMIQAAGRTDRRNTTYTDLYYYHMKSHAPIDLAISRSLNMKKDFNERGFLGGK